MLKRLLVAAMALALVGLIGACAAPLTAEEEPTPTPIPTPVVPEKPVYEVKRGEVVDSVDFLCRVAPVREQELFFKMNGRVATVSVQKGDAVTEGQILAELENQDILNQVEQARLDLEKAEIALSQAEAAREDKLVTAQRNLEIARIKLEQAQQQQRFAVAQAEMDLQNAQIRLQQALASDPSLSLKEAESALARAEGNLRQAQIAYADAAQDPSKAGPAQEAYRTALLEYELALARYESAQEAASNAAYNVQLLRNAVETARLNLERARSGVDPILEQNVAAAELEVARLEAGVDPALEKNVASAQLRLDRLTAQLDAARIVAPFDGTVTGVLAFEGREAQAYKAVIVIAEPGAVELSCDITSSIMDKLAEGMQATIIFSDTPGETLSGTVRRLPYPYGGGGVRTDSTQQEDKSTRISFDDTKGRDLQTGQLAKVSVVIERRTDTLYLPPQAIRTFEGRRFVVVQDEEGRQRRLDVKIGITSADRIEILEGVEEGQVVVGP
ncbi:MAG: HlyD family efflux transporter periplasmic adaptor subunit [Anaerolineae bacterium]|nr:HlyD family efflux transporter periplasmic adaptor subunit [Anaerolineae bacterium]